MRLLVTRPLADGERTAAKLRARGQDVLLAPLLELEFLSDADLGPGPWAALAFTSANAARAMEKHPRFAELSSLPVFAVGRRTAAAARVAGFEQVTSADGNKDDLATLIGTRSGGPVLYLAGDDRAGELELGSIPVETVVVYRVAPVAAVPPAVVEALDASQLDGVLHYSQRSATAYVDLAAAAGVLDRALAPVHYCISTRAAEPLQQASAPSIQVAHRPDETSLLDLIMMSA